MSVVVLNRNYEYWTEVSIRKVLKWMVKDKIEIVLTSKTQEIKLMTVSMKMPLVVRLLGFVGFKPKSEKIPFTQEAVFYRDNFFCSYYHKDDKGKRFRYKCLPDELTIDHIIPLSRGGANDFRNCTTACRNCNEIIKKNRTPAEAGLELIRIPVIPKRDKNSFVVARFNYDPSKKSHIAFCDFMGMT